MLPIRLLTLGFLVTAKSGIGLAVPDSQHGSLNIKRDAQSDFFGPHGVEYTQCFQNSKEGFQSDGFLATLATWIKLHPNNTEDLVTYDEKTDKATYHLHNIPKNSYLTLTGKVVDTQDRVVEHSKLLSGADGPDDSWFVKGAETAACMVEGTEGYKDNKIQDRAAGLAIWILTGRQPYQGAFVTRTDLFEEVKISDHSMLTLLTKKDASKHLSPDTWVGVMRFEGTTEEGMKMKLWDPTHNKSYWVSLKDAYDEIYVHSKIRDEKVTSI
ncbi:uncharacterized protein IL334_007333 [Kwoniella shivajii]|uniref:Calpain catalytic domain-containing protein n=1 Tax=Kwoniella shivajii TaxID=564305 RepID=A0ABZ1D8W0_9TREE|nr:hypothetical protein IL334_007333 [Kwoniella shivajii]